MEGTKLQRLIKFRAWDNQARMMVGGGGMQMNATTGKLENIASIIIMQWTGLKDKNGIEIFEGDTIYHHKYGERWVVVWIDDACGFSLEDKGGHHMNLSKLCEKNIEVIGNDYEGVTR